MVDRPDPLIGTHLGDYSIEALIGRGGMARVYEALDEKLGRKAAVKVIEVEHEKADEMTQRFIREARAAANLDHPNIISVYQFGEDNNLYYLAMKLIEGHTLLNILKKRRQQKKFMEPEEILNIVSQIAAALDYAHSKGVIHRDIKPSNIMLTDDNRAILTDFGLTMQVGNDSTLGTAFGTPRYISPEQAMASHRAVPQSDIYSLGVILYEMTTGQAPFDSDSPMSLALSHISNPPPEPKSVRPDLPHPVQMVLLKALEKRPENRWQSATEMVDALRAAYQGIEPNVSLSQEKLDTPPSRRANLRRDENDSTALIAGKKPAAGNRRGARPRRVSRVIILLLLIALVGGGYLVVKNLGTTPVLAGLFSTPSPMPIPDVKLIYSKDSFYIYNNTSQTISLEGISFKRNEQGALAFDANKFGDPTYKNLAAKQCFYIAPLHASQQNNPDICKTPQKGWLYEDDNTSWIFWTMKNDKDPVDNFLVLKRGGAVLQQCPTRVNTCEFSLP